MLLYDFTLTTQNNQLAATFAAGNTPPVNPPIPPITVKILLLAHEPLEHVPVNLDRTPGHTRVGKEGEQHGLLERFQVALAKAHRKTPAQLSIAKVVQRLGDDGLVQGMWGGHGSSEPERSTRRRERRSRRKNFTRPVSERRGSALDICGFW
jgi:hypothetical protein